MGMKACQKGAELNFNPSHSKKLTYQIISKIVLITKKKNHQYLVRQLQNKLNWFTSNSFDNCPIIIRLVCLISV